MMQKNQLPIPRASQPSTIVALHPASTLSSEDWGWFAGGFMLGTFITLATTGLGSALNPCVGKIAYVALNSFTFYIYMIVFEEGEFADKA